jgi:hypothetical protein
MILMMQSICFADDGDGNFLADNTQKLVAHSESLRAAFLLTDNEFIQIITHLGFDANTPLNLDNISSLFRRGWLARKLKLSVQEFLLLTQFTGFDPFVAPDPASPPILRLIELVNRLRQVSLKPVQALYLIWNQDISGKSVPAEQEILEFARSLRAGFAAIGLLGNTLTTTVTYSHGQPTLEQPILDVAPGRLTYDDFRKQVTFKGVLTPTLRDTLKTVTGVTAQFQTAIDNLYAENQQIINPFFDRYPELQPLYAAYAFFMLLRTIPNLHSITPNPNSLPFSLLFSLTRW